MCRVCVALTKLSMGFRSSFATIIHHCMVNDVSMQFSYLTIKEQKILESVSVYYDCCNINRHKKLQISM